MSAQYNLGNMKQNSKSSIIQNWSQSALTECALNPFALVRFKKSVMDNTKGRPPDSNDKFLWLKVYVGFDTLTLCSVVHVIKDTFLIPRHYLIKKWIIGNSQMQHWSCFMSSNTSPITVFICKPFLGFLNLANTLWGVQILLKCWHHLS